MSTSEKRHFSVLFLAPAMLLLSVLAGTAGNDTFFGNESAASDACEGFADDCFVPVDEVVNGTVGGLEHNETDETGDGGFVDVDDYLEAPGNESAYGEGESAGSVAPANESPVATEDPLTPPDNEGFVPVGELPWGAGNYSADDGGNLLPPDGAGEAGGEGLMPGEGGFVDIDTYLDAVGRDEGEMNESAGAEESGAPAIEGQQQGGAGNETEAPPGNPAQEEAAIINESLSPTGGTPAIHSYETVIVSAKGTAPAPSASVAGPYVLAEGEYLGVEGPQVYPGSGDFSASIWVRTSDTGDGVALSSTECGTIESYWSITKAWVGDAAVMAIRINGGNGETSVSGTRNVADGAWHHLVFVRDAAGGRIIGYMDGEVELQFEDTGMPISDGSVDLTAGAANPYQDEWFAGDVGGIETYPRALTAAEVGAMSADGPPG